MDATTHGQYRRDLPPSQSEEYSRIYSSHAVALLRARPERPRGSGTAEQRDELAAPCMSGKQHSERRRGFGHDRLSVATGSPQALRIPIRE